MPYGNGADYFKLARPQESNGNTNYRGLPVRLKPYNFKKKSSNK
ncbi:hypothetical protein Cpap_1752 [Ruminiclostridium papyrosolvens DSM 2782]|uniref:Uncharacterized protein n=1 Tax=Ruminiclostridium papyrosolvens DSM 2782 TaxID=588581 RepID=F1TDC1_9FIRM|nr:hypothetical protein Cpap_1752 [Ruminiclostridium papyrosolvens DSM 2782]